MLSESSKKLKLYKLIDTQTGREETSCYMTKEEVTKRNNGYQLNRSPKRYKLAGSFLGSKNTNNQ